MAYLIYWNALCWEAGSIVPTEIRREEIVPTQREAIRRVNRAAVTARNHAERDIKIILSEPERFEFNSGYSYVALAIAVPRGTKTVDVAYSWLTEQDENEKNDTLDVVAYEGGNLSPPLGRKEPMSKRECLEMLLAWLR